jgi:hypothetical protein
MAAIVVLGNSINEGFSHGITRFFRSFSQHAWAANEFSAYGIHQLAYRAARQRFALPSQRGRNQGRQDHRRVEGVAGPNASPEMS